MRVSTKDFLEGLAFCKKAVKRTKHWACTLLFISPDHIFVWDGEQGARYPIATGLTFTIYFDSVVTAVRATRNEGLAEVELSAENNYLMVGEKLAGEAYTELGRMPELDKRHTVELTECNNLVEMLQAATRVIEPPSWVEGAAIISEKALVASDGICVFYAENNGTEPLYKHRWGGGKPSIWLSWRFCKTLTRNDPPQRIRIGTDRAVAAWDNGAELISMATRSDEVSDGVAAYVAPDKRPVRCDMPTIRKLVADALRENEVASVGVFPHVEGDSIGFEISSSMVLTSGNELYPHDVENCPQFYLDALRLKAILDVVHSYDGRDFTKANADNTNWRQAVRFYGDAPSPFIIALGVQR